MTTQPATPARPERVRLLLERAEMAARTRDRLHHLARLAESRVTDPAAADVLRQLSFGLGDAMHSVARSYAEAANVLSPGPDDTGPDGESGRAGEPQ